MLKGVTPTVIAPIGDVSFAYKPAPKRLNIQQFLDDKTLQIPLENGSFNAPNEQGT